MEEEKSTKRYKPPVSEIFLYLQHGRYAVSATESKKRVIRRAANANFKVVTLEETKLLDKLQKRYWWPDLVFDVKQYLQTCERCQLVNRKANKVNPPLQPVPVTKPQPWRSIGIDLVGPLRETVDGNKYICTVTCYYTKWAQAKALPNKEASGVARYLMELFLCFGFPKTLISDQGREFNNIVVHGMRDALNIGHRRTVAYHPQCNGLTERFNQTLENMLLKLDQDAEWNVLLPQVVFAYNTSKHASTKCSPFFLREPTLPDDVSDSDTTETEPVSYETLENEINLRVTSMTNVIGGKAISNIEEAQRRQKRNYDKRLLRQEEFAVGSKVLKKIKKIKKNGPKRRKTLAGALLIRAITKRGTYLLSTMDGIVLKNGINGANLKEWQELDKPLEKVRK